MITYSRLRHYRKKCKLTQQEVAERLGLKNASLICRWETGFSLPDLCNAARLAMLYGVNIETLFPSLFNNLESDTTNSS